MPSGSTLPTTATYKPLPLPKLKRDGRRAAYIRTWAMIDNMADAYTIVRAVEQKYGSIAEARILRDYEMPEMYQAKILVLFRDADSVERIPALGENLHVLAPEVVPDQPGGVGLADIAHLLEPQGKSETLSFLEGLNTPSVEGTGRTINFKIEPKLHTTPPSKSPSIHLSNRRLAETGRNFLKWGGFYNLQPIESTRPITDDELFCGSTLDHVRMRRTLRYWAEATGDPNPFEIPPKGEPVKDAAENISIPPTSHPHPTDVQETEIPPQSTIASSVEAASSLSEPSENISVDVAAPDVASPLESTAGLHTTQDLAADMLQTSPPSSSEDVYFSEVVSEEPNSQEDKTDDSRPSPPVAPAAASKK